MTMTLPLLENKIDIQRDILYHIAQGEGNPETIDRKWFEPNQQKILDIIIKYRKQGSIVTQSVIDYEAGNDNTGKIQGEGNMVINHSATMSLPAAILQYREIIAKEQATAIGLELVQYANGETSKQLKDILKDAAAQLPQDDTAPIVVRSLVDFARMQPKQEDILLGSSSPAYLTVGGCLMIVGPSGVGKSTLGIQQDLLWAIGKEACGIKAVRPLSILSVQAENNESDMQYLCSKVMSALNLTPAEQDLARKNTKSIWKNDATGTRFIECLDKWVAEYKPNILRVDPLQAFLGGDPSNPEATAEFCRIGLNSIGKKYNCGIILIHHTPKTNRNDRDTSKWNDFDWQYSGTGSADLANWARAIMVLNPKAERGMFEFIAAKRNPGWKDANGEWCKKRYYKHGKGEVLWHLASDDDIMLANRVGRPKITTTLESYIPEAIEIIEKSCPCTTGILEEKLQDITGARNRARELVKVLLHQGKIDTKQGKGTALIYGTLKQLESVRQ